MPNNLSSLSSTDLELVTGGNTITARSAGLGGAMDPGAMMAMSSLNSTLAQLKQPQQDSTLPLVIAMMAMGGKNKQTVVGGGPGFNYWQTSYA